MNNEEILKKVMDELSKKENASAPEAKAEEKNNLCSLTEFVGTTMGDTIGLVIANVDGTIHEQLGIDKKYRSLGIVTSRVGAGPQAMAADEAVKSSNTEVVKFELSRDMEGGGGHGIMIVFGGQDVSDVRRAVEITLDTVPTYMGDCYLNSAGHVEAEYTARASSVLAKYLGAEEGKSWGFLCCCPAGIGIVAADTAAKAANVKIVQTSSPQNGTAFSNEYMVMMVGDSGAVRQAVIAGRDVSLKLVEALNGEKPEAATPSYIGK